MKLITNKTFSQIAVGAQVVQYDKQTNERNIFCNKIPFSKMTQRRDREKLERGNFFFFSPIS